MKWHPGSILGLALTLVLPSSANATEPNDTIATATSAGLVGEGTTFVGNGVVGDGDWLDRDVDIYSFELDPETTFPVLVTVEAISETSDFDGFLRFFDASGFELANNDDGSFSTNDPLIEALVLTSGTYYVGVGSAANPHYDNTVGGSGRTGSGGPYTLTIRAKSVPGSASVLEPNDRIATASGMGSDSFAVSEFIGDGAQGRRDVDVYMLRLTRAARIDVRVSVEDIGSPLEPVVRIRTCMDGIDTRTQADECAIGSSDNVPNGSLDALTSAGVLEAQDIYVLVSGAGNRRFDPATAGSGEAGSVGPYSLDVSVAYFDIAAPEEPNDSLGMATRLDLIAPDRFDFIQVERFLGDGRFAPFQGDRDFYEVTLIDDTRLLLIDVVPLEGSVLDPVVVIYDLNGNVIAHNDNAGLTKSAGLVLPVECVPAVAGAKSAFVAVMGTGQRPPRDPFLPFADATTVEPDTIGDGPGSTGAYRLTIDASTETVTCVKEPDDALSAATETGLVDVGSYVCTNGEIGDSECANPGKDVDIWSFEVVHPPVRLEVSLATCRVDALPRFSIGLFDNAGELLALLDVNDAPQESRLLTARIDQPGRYFVVVAGFLDQNKFDPNTACSTAVDALGTYDLILRLDRGRGGPGLGRRETGSGDSPGDGPIFASLLNQETNRIDAVDSNTGAVLSSFTAPEPLSGGSEGLAFDGTRLFYLGVGIYPRLYHLDPTSGAVEDEMILWFGSGFFSDAVMLGGELFLLDYRNRSVHVIDPIGRRLLRTLHVGHLNGMTIAGGLAALAGPDRLYVADAFNTRTIVEIDPVLGIRTATLSPPSAISRPTALAGSGTSTLFVGDWQSNVLARMDRAGNDLGDVVLDGAVGALAGEAAKSIFGDFDFDGDVDLRDFARYQTCLAGLGGLSIGECVPGNLNGDQEIDLIDYAGFPAAMTGP